MVLRAFQELMNGLGKFPGTVGTCEKNCNGGECGAPILEGVGCARLAYRRFSMGQMLVRDKRDWIDRWPYEKWLETLTGGAE